MRITRRHRVGKVDKRPAASPSPLHEERAVREPLRVFARFQGARTDRTGAGAGTRAARHGLSALVKRTLRIGVVCAAFGLSMATGTAQDLNGVSMTPVMTRLRATAPPGTAQASASAAGAFLFAPLPAGAKLDVDGVFKTRKLFKTWTINFAGSAEVTKSDARSLVLHVTATGTNSIFEGHTRKIELSFEQSADTPQVKFIGRELEDKSEPDVGITLTATGVEAAGTQLMRPPPDGREPSVKRDGILIVDDGAVLTIRYDQNVIRVKRPIVVTDPGAPRS